MATVADYKYEKAEVMSYFEQFNDYEIDLTKYLTNFSTSANPLTLSNTQPVKVKVKNLFTKIQTTIDLKNNPSDFSTHIIEDYEDAIQISKKYYGIIDYWWLIYSINNITDPYKDWPLTNDEVSKLADVLYTKEGKYTKEAYQDLLFEQNENKRKILIPSIDIVVYMMTEYNRLVLQSKGT